MKLVTSEDSINYTKKIHQKINIILKIRKKFVYKNEGIKRNTVGGDRQYHLISAWALECSYLVFIHAQDLCEDIKVLSAILAIEQPR